MAVRHRIHNGLAAVLLGAVLCLQGAAQPAETGGHDCVNQSPRTLGKYDLRLEKPTVVQGVKDTIIYTPPGGTATRLRRCGQHYHCRIENLQPDCPGQVAREVGTPPLCAQPSVDSWVEIHTVYAPKVRGQGCDKETLNCCEGLPVVVKAYHARVMAGGQNEPVPVLWNLPAAEWSGSNTGPDDYPGGCKPIPARWSFTLGCGFKVTWAQLAPFHHPEPARGLQPRDRLSTDLAEVPKP